MAGDNPWMKLWIGDYLRTNVAGCSLAAQGLYFRLKIIMHETENPGYLQVGGKPMPDDMVCRKCGCSEGDYAKLMKELLLTGDVGKQDGVLYDREILSKLAISKTRANAGSKGGSKTQALATLRSDYENEYDNDSSVPELLRSAEFRESWIDWLVHRAELGKKTTNNCKRQQLSKLAGMGKARAVNALRHSVSNGWQGIFEPKEASNGNQARGRSTTQADHDGGW
jgi:hypothetical protein